MRLQPHSLVVLAFACLFGASTRAQATEADANAAKAMDPYARLKISLGSGGSSLKQTADAEVATAAGSDNRAPRATMKLLAKKAPNKTSKKKAAQDPEQPIASTASAELTVEKSDLSSGVLPTPGTVRSAIAPVVDPVSRPVFEAGLSLQSYQPAGRMKLPSMEPFDLGTIPAGPMLALEVRWLPLHFAAPFAPSQPLSFGPFMSVGYSALPVKLSTPSGAPITKTELHLLKAEAGGALAWQPAERSPWGARFELGGGQLTETQASSSSYANHSAALLFASAGLYGERRFMERLTVFLGYDHRVPLRGEPDEITLQRSNILAGLTGGFQ